jgi:hypothetical protein
MSRGKPVTGWFALRLYAPDVFVYSIQERPYAKQTKEDAASADPARSAEKLKSRGGVRGLVGVESAAAEDPTR